MNRDWLRYAIAGAVVAAAIGALAAVLPSPPATEQRLGTTRGLNDGGTR